MIPVDVLARVPLAPVLAAQAVAVRSSALVLPEPPGERVGRSGKGPSLRVLIVGDSSAAGVGAATQETGLSGQLAHALSRHYDVSWQLQARTGATTKSTLADLDGLSSRGFDIAVLALGVNDVTRIVTRRQWTARQRTLHQLLQDRFGIGRIYACGLPPMGLFPLLPQPLRWILGAQAARLDQALAEVAMQNPSVRHVPFDFPHEPHYFAPDGYHPSDVAYAHWGKRMARLIVED